MFRARFCPFWGRFQAALGLFWTAEAPLPRLAGLAASARSMPAMPFDIFSRTRHADKLADALGLTARLHPPSQRFQPSRDTMPNPSSAPVVVIAPDSFKGSLSAEQVAQAIATGVTRARPDASVRICPMADGGEGTLDAMLTGGGERRMLTVRGAAGPVREAATGLLARRQRDRRDGGDRRHYRSGRHGRAGRSTQLARHGRSDSRAARRRRAALFRRAWRQQHQ